MSKIQGVPFIQVVLGTIGSLKSDLLDLVNGSDKTPEFRSLVNKNALITGSDKNKVQYITLETWAKTYTGYLIYNNSYCVLIAFSSNTQALVMLNINPTKATYVVVKEYLDINELRRYLEEADEHIVVGEIDSTGATEGQVLAADGDGGAEWKDGADTIKMSDVDEGVATKMAAFDASGNLIYTDIPSGTLVADPSLDKTSHNAIENAPVATAIENIEGDITDIDAELETKANVDGNYPTMTVGAADNLTPYDEESGVLQQQPFLLQGTGCGNGEQQVDTGALALLKEKQGNSVVVNQQVNQANIPASETVNDITFTYSNGIMDIDGTSTNTSFSTNINVPLIAGHKYLASSVDIPNATNSYIQVYDSGNATAYAGLFTATYTVSDAYFRIRIESGLQVNHAKCYMFLIDLTQWFGSNDNIPPHLLSHPENFFRYYQGDLSYNEGELVNANGRYVKCIKMNQWDEEWELGDLNTTNGAAYPDNTRIRSKYNNPIVVIPNAKYYIKTPNALTMCAYDKDDNFIEQVYVVNNILTIPSNSKYLRFSVQSAYGTTYNHDISINLYYEKSEGVPEPRCLTYESYELLTNNDTGTEELRSAGSVYDSKAPDGTIARRIGVVDLGDLTFSKAGDDHTFFTTISNAKETGYSVCNAISAIYTNIGEADWNQYTNIGDMTVSHQSSTKNFYFANGNYSDAAAFKAAMSGVYLFYELAEPTTEQGTPFSENLVIDDFGSMSFEGTNGVPQGNLIFYPVDYKAFIDTLYNYTQGTPSNIALKSDLAVVDNKIGAKLPECPTTTDGTYVLKATVSDGEVVYTWESEA